MRLAWLRDPLEKSVNVAPDVTLAAQAWERAPPRGKTKTPPGGVDARQARSAQVWRKSWNQKYAIASLAIKNVRSEGHFGTLILGLRGLQGVSTYGYKG